MTTDPQTTTPQTRDTQTRDTQTRDAQTRDAQTRDTQIRDAQIRDAQTQARWRLRGRSRRTVLVLHILAAAAWFGVDIMVAVFVLAGWFSGDDGVRAVAYQALGTFVLWPMLVSGLTSLGTGVLLGLGSRYGLVRYWWVAVKLAINLVLCTLIILLLRPELGELGPYGRELADGTAGEHDVSQLFFPPAVSLSALTFATALAVFKPWGRLRER